MKIALCSDEPYPLLETIRTQLEKRGHRSASFGATESETAPWASSAEKAALSIARGENEEGIFVCWSGTGIAMAANKVPTIRAALCLDAGSAAAARTWNHANVLCLSSRATASDIANEILDRWFETPWGAAGKKGTEDLLAVDERWRRR